MSWWKRLMGDSSGGDSSRPVNYLAEALELEKRGNYSDALTSYRLALRDKPEDLQVLQNMAIAFSRTSQPEEAIRSYRKALQIDPELAGAHYGLAFLLLKRGYTAPAAVHLEGFLRNSTGDDAQSAKFRAHAQHTLDEIRAMGGTERGDGAHGATEHSDNSGAQHDAHDASATDHMNRPES